MGCVRLLPSAVHDLSLVHTIHTPYKKNVCKYHFHRITLSYLLDTGVHIYFLTYARSALKSRLATTSAFQTFQFPDRNVAQTTCYCEPRRFGIAEGLSHRFEFKSTVAHDLPVRSPSYLNTGINPALHRG
jgi:hypothetical protein